MADDYTLRLGVSGAPAQQRGLADMADEGRRMTARVLENARTAAREISRETQTTRELVRALEGDMAALEETTRRAFGEQGQSGVEQLFGAMRKNEARELAQAMDVVIEKSDTRARMAERTANALRREAEAQREVLRVETQRAELAERAARRAFDAHTPAQPYRRNFAERAIDFAPLGVSQKAERAVQQWRAARDAAARAYRDVDYSGAQSFAGRAGAVMRDIRSRWARGSQDFADDLTNDLTMGSDWPARDRARAAGFLQSPFARRAGGDPQIQLLMRRLRHAVEAPGHEPLRNALQGMSRQELYLAQAGLAHGEPYGVPADRHVSHQVAEQIRRVEQDLATRRRTEQMMRETNAVNQPGLKALAAERRIDEGDRALAPLLDRITAAVRRPGHGPLRDTLIGMSDDELYLAQAGLRRGRAHVPAARRVQTEIDRRIGEVERMHESVRLRDEMIRETRWETEPGLLELNAQRRASGVGLSSPFRGLFGPGPYDLKGQGRASARQIRRRAVDDLVRRSNQTGNEWAGLLQRGRETLGFVEGEEGQVVTPPPMAMRLLNQGGEHHHTHPPFPSGVPGGPLSPGDLLMAGRGKRPWTTFAHDTQTGARYGARVRASNRARYERNVREAARLSRAHVMDALDAERLDGLNPDEAHNLAKWIANRALERHGDIRMAASFSDYERDFFGGHQDFIDMAVDDIAPRLRNAGRPRPLEPSELLASPFSDWMDRRRERNARRRRARADGYHDRDAYLDPSVRPRQRQDRRRYVEELLANTRRTGREYARFQFGTGRDSVMYEGGKHGYGWSRGFENSLLEWGGHGGQLHHTHPGNGERADGGRIGGPLSYPDLQTAGNTQWGSVWAHDAATGASYAVHVRNMNQQAYREAVANASRVASREVADRVVGGNGRQRLKSFQGLTYDEATAFEIYAATQGLERAGHVRAAARLTPYERNLYFGGGRRRSFDAIANAVAEEVGHYDGPSRAVRHTDEYIAGRLRSPMRRDPRLDQVHQIIESLSGAFQNSGLPGALGQAQTMSRDDLRLAASALGVPGRGTMRRDELAHAVARVFDQRSMPDSLADVLASQARRTANRAADRLDVADGAIDPARLRLERAQAREDELHRREREVSQRRAHERPVVPRGRGGGGGMYEPGRRRQIRRAREQLRDYRAGELFDAREEVSAAEVERRRADVNERVARHRSNAMESANELVGVLREAMRARGAAGLGDIVSGANMGELRALSRLLQIPGRTRMDRGQLTQSAIDAIRAEGVTADGYDRIGSPDFRDDTALASPFTRYAEAARDAARARQAEAAAAGELADNLRRAYQEGGQRGLREAIGGMPTDELQAAAGDLGVSDRGGRGRVRRRVSAAIREEAEATRDLAAAMGSAEQPAETLGARMREITAEAGGGAGGVASFNEAGQELQGLLQSQGNRLGVFGRLLGRLGPAGTAAAAGLGLAVGAMTAAQRIGEVLVNTWNEIGGSADRIGISTEALQALRREAVAAGAPVERLEDFILRLEQGGLDAARGTGAFRAALENSHPALVEAVAAAGSQEERLSAVIEALQNAETATERARIANAAFGREGRVFANALANMEGGLEGVIDSAREAGAIMDDHVIRNTQRMRSEMDLAARATRTNLMSAFREIMDLAPGLGGLFATMSEGVRDFTEMLRAVENRESQTLRDEVRAIDAQIAAIETALEEGGERLDEAVEEAFGAPDSAEGYFGGWRAFFADLAAEFGEAGDQGFANLDRHIDEFGARSGARGAEALLESLRGRRDARQSILDERAEEARNNPLTGDGSGDPPIGGGDRTEDFRRRLAQLRYELGDIQPMVELYIESLDELQSATDLTDRERGDLLEREVERLRAGLELNQRAQAVADSVREPLERYTERLVELEDLHDKGAISAEVYAAAVRMARDEYERSDPVMSGAAEIREQLMTANERLAREEERVAEMVRRRALTQGEATEYLRNYEEALRRTGDAVGWVKAQEELLDRVLSGQIRTWEDLGRAILDVISRVLTEAIRAQWGVEQSFGSMLSNVIGSVFGGGGLAGGGGQASTPGAGAGAGTAQLPTFHSGGVITRADRVATPGLGQNEVDARLEIGERVFTAMDNQALVGAVSRMSSAMLAGIAGGGARGVALNLFVNNQSQAQVEFDQPRIGANGDIELKAWIRDTVRGQFAQGEFDRELGAMGARRGASRR